MPNPRGLINKPYLWTIVLIVSALLTTGNLTLFNPALRDGSAPRPMGRPAMQVGLCEGELFVGTRIYLPLVLKGSGGSVKTFTAATEFFVRGFIVTTPTGPTGQQLPGGEIYLPEITVCLKVGDTGDLVEKVRTDLSGRFSFSKQPPGRYQLCWEAAGFVSACLDEFISIESQHLHLGPLPIQIDLTETHAPVYGQVRLRDNSLPRTFEPFANVNALAQVYLRDAAGNELDRVYVNNYSDYLIPQAPVNADIWLEASLEDITTNRAIIASVLSPAVAHRTDIRFPNHRPRFDPVVASVDGERVRRVDPGTVVNLQAEATDADGDPLAYRWILPPGSGTLSSLSGSSVDWELPASVALHAVEVVAYDGQGGYAKARISISTGEGIVFSGKVLDPDGTGIPDAQIDINGQTTATNVNGFFRLHVTESQQYVLNIRKQGYGLLSRVYLDGVTAGRWTLTPATVVNVDPTQDIDVTDDRTRNDCSGPLSGRIEWERYPNQRLPRFQDGRRNLVRVGELGFRFEQLPLGQRYVVGDSFVELGTEVISATVRPFVFSNGTVFSDGFTEVVADGLAGGSGNELAVNNVNLDFDFGGPLSGLTMRFGEYGGNLNLDINGDFRNFDNFSDIHGLIIGGVNVSVVNGLGNDVGSLRLTGPIQSFSVGGQELWIDDVLENSLPDLPGDRQCGPGLRIFIPANSLVDSNGTPPPGNVDVAVSTFNILSPDGLPGDYTAADNAGLTRVMESFGAGSVSVTAGGESYNLEPGAVATLTIPIDPIHFDPVYTRPIPATIPNLVYSETVGIWEEIGQWTLVGNEYVTTVGHFSEFNTDLLKEDQACVRIHSPELPAQYRLEVTIPQGPGAVPKVISGNVDNSVEWHVVYNLPTNTEIVLVAIRQDEDIPIGTFVVNTGGPQNPTDPNRPVYPYGACQSDVELYDPELSDPPSAASDYDAFLNGLYSFIATNLDEYTPASPDDPSPEELAALFDGVTDNYYNLIDPHGLRETLDEFIDVNDFNLGPEVHAVYANSGDLGFGRDMHCRRQEVSPGVYDVACYVSNYGDFFTPDEADFEAAANQDTAVATVAMEYTRIEDPGDPTMFVSPDRVVKFYVYGADGTRVNSADLDGFGARPIPQLCMVCHGGSANYDGAPSPTNPPVFETVDDVDLGSVFLPFDLTAFTIVDGLTVEGMLGLFDKAAQQDEFRQLNEEIVLSSDPGPAIEEVIANMYPGPGDQIEDFVIPGWSSDPAHDAMYRNVVARACRACHVAQLDTDITFRTSTQATDLASSIRFRVCQQGVMPHARATYDRFWTSISPHQPAQLISWGNVFAPALDWSICATAAPVDAPDPPEIVYHDPYVQQIWTNYGCDTCHPPNAGLDLTAGNAYDQIVNQPSTQLPPMDLIEPNQLNQSYLWHKVNGTQGGVGGSGDQMPVGGPFLTDPGNEADLSTLQEWIQGGALESP